jgi:hypothetical protein
VSEYRGIFNLLARWAWCPTAGKPDETTWKGRYVLTDHNCEHAVGDVVAKQCPCCDRWIWVELLPDLPGAHTSTAFAMNLGGYDQPPRPQYFTYEWPTHMWTPPRYNHTEIRQRIASFRFRIKQSVCALHGEEEWS